MNSIQLLIAIVLSLGITAFSEQKTFADPITAAPKEWTFLVYLNGDNNLDEDGVANTEEMKQIGSSAAVNVVILRDTPRTSESTKIYYVEKGKVTVVKDYGKNIDMGDWHTLVDFFKFAQEKFPAKKFLLDIWDHGSGWKIERVEPRIRGISYDDNSGNHITTPQLGEAMRQIRVLNGGRKIDVLGMDACLMQMAEVVYEINDSVEIVAASEEVEPAAGWPYQKILAPLIDKPTMTAEALGAVIEQQYVESFNGGVHGTGSVQGSVVRASALALAIDSFRSLSDYMTQIAPSAAAGFKKAALATQQYADQDYKDVFNFLEIAKQDVPDAHFQDLADKTYQAFGLAVAMTAWTGDGLKNSHGISVWIPTSEDGFAAKKTEYATLKWTQATKWGDFLDAMDIPKFPMIGVNAVSYTDGNGDGFVTAGEKLTFQLELINDSPVAASGVKAFLIPPAEASSVVESVDVGAIGEEKKIVKGLTAVLSPNINPGTYVFKFRIAIPGVPDVMKEFPVHVDGAYTIENRAVSTPHDYPTNFNQSYTISRAGVAGLRIHFAKFATEATYDFVILYDKNGKEIAKYNGALAPFWSPYIPGDTVTVRLTSDYSNNAYGFDIDKIAY